MIMELQMPRLIPVLLQWDLGIVLEALSKTPFEPLREAFLKHLTLKTVFLLAMASARRRNELQALVFDPQYNCILYSSNLKELEFFIFHPRVHAKKSEAKPSQCSVVSPSGSQIPYSTEYMCRREHLNIQRGSKSNDVGRLRYSRMCQFRF